MDDMVQKARELGIALANCPEYIRMLHAKEALQKEETVNEVIGELAAKKIQLISSVSGDAPNSSTSYDAALLSQDIERLQGQLTENPFFMEMTAAEKEFSGLLSAINREINLCIGFEEDQSTCNGNCAGCGGCSH